MFFYDAIKELKRKTDEGAEYPANLGYSLELCTRTVDKDLPLNEIAQEEIERLCGYKVSLDRIEQAMTYPLVVRPIEWPVFISLRFIFRSDVGATGGEATLFYCEVTNEDKISNAAGVNGDSDGRYLRQLILFAL